MARATHPGAPQRVSAHVVPKAPSFSNDDEEEKTTIESGGWEEEASTTVEQGEVAEKVRALANGAAQARSNTAITSTTGSGVNDEPTVDDQRASAALALLPPPSVARLVITQGNDAGRQLEVRPGKTYTIGRGIDNDLVLSDITASRKHFDIRHENGSWILADRASGNGTSINSRIEDAPFMLASGDTIEVGNTAFRFEVVTTAISLPGLPGEAAGAAREAPAGARDGRGPTVPTVEDPSDSRELPTPAVHAPPVSRELINPAVLREASAAPAREAPELRDAGAERARGPDRVPDEAPSFDGSVDDDLELSTVSGKPMQDADPARPVVTASRPKTLPPPAPLPRPRTQTGRPPLAFAATRSQQMAVAQPIQPPIPPVALAAAMAPTISPMHAVPALPQPATTLPLPQMANRPPLAPGLLDSSLGSSLPQLTQGPSLPATLPGQGPPVQPNRAPRLPFSYPSAPELLAQRSSGIMRAPLNVAAAHPGRDATSTALVQPMSYSGGGQAVVVPQPARRMAPLLSPRMLIALGLVTIAVFAAIVTIVILRSAAGTSSRPGRDSASTTPPAAVASAPPGRPAAPAPTRPPTVTPIQSTPDATPSGSAAVRTAADKGTPAAPAGPAAPDKVPVAAGPASASPTSPPAGSATASPPAAPAPATPTSPATPRVAAADKITPPPGPSAPGPMTPPSAPPVSGATVPAAPAVPPATPARPTGEIATSSPATATAGPAEPAHTAGSDKAHADASSAKATRPAKHTEPKKSEHKVEVAAATPPRATPHHGGRSLQDVKSEATGLYRSKNFSGAAAAINSSLSGFSGDDVKDLKAIAAIYSQLGKAYAIGMAPGTRPIEAYQALLRASDYDREVGGAYAMDLHDKLVAIAPRAATSYMAAKSFEQAFQTVRKAEDLGSRSDDLKIVRQNLEDKAKELLRTARSELASDPDDAKQKLRQIQGMVERQNTLWQQAAKLLNGP